MSYYSRTNNRKGHTLNYKTHLIGGVQTGLILMNVIPESTPAEKVLMMSASLAGSILPDIDKRKSKLCYEDLVADITSSIICRFTNHRGMTHTVWFALLLALLFAKVIPINPRLGTNIIIGVFVFAIIRAIRLEKVRSFGLLGGIAAFYFANFRLTEPLFGLELSFTENANRYLAVGIFFGCLSHMIYDTFNSHGIEWLSPFTSRHFSLGNIKTNHRSERVFRVVMIVLAVVLLAFFINSNYPEFLRSLR